MWRSQITRPAVLAVSRRREFHQPLVRVVEVEAEEVVEVVVVEVAEVVAAEVVRSHRTASTRSSPRRPPAPRSIPRRPRPRAVVVPAVAAPEAEPARRGLP